MASRKISLSPLQNRRIQQLIRKPDQSVHQSGTINAHEEDEVKEVLSQLVHIRKQHDQTKELNLKKRIEYEKLVKELDNLNETSNLNEKDQLTVNNRASQLQTALESTKQKVNEELQNKKVYEHMLSRMKKDHISMEVQQNSLQKVLKSARQILDQEKHRFRKGNEAKFQSKQMLQTLRNNIDVEKRQNDETVTMLQKGIKLRQEAAFRREDRQRRQEEIAETAAHENTDGEEIRLREQLNMYRFWYNVLKWRLEREMEESSEIEDAFQQIKTATGIGNIESVVEMFLTREEHHSQLMQAVSEAETRLDQLRSENEQARQQFQELQLVQGEGVSREFIVQVEDLNNKIAEKQKSAVLIGDRLDKASEVYDSILNWGYKVGARLDDNLNIKVLPASQIEDTQSTLADLYEHISNKLTEIIEPIIEKKEEIEDLLLKQQSKSTREVVEELQKTKEFVSKNKRVVEDKRMDSDDELSQLQINMEQQLYGCTLEDLVNMKLEKRRRDQIKSQTPVFMIQKNEYFNEFDFKQPSLTNEQLEFLLRKREVPLFHQAQSMFSSYQRATISPDQQPRQFYQKLNQTDCNDLAVCQTKQFQDQIWQEDLGKVQTSRYPQAFLSQDLINKCAKYNFYQHQDLIDKIQKIKARKTVRTATPSSRRRPSFQQVSVNQQRQYLSHLRKYDPDCSISIDKCLLKAQKTCKKNKEKANDLKREMIKNLQKKSISVEKPIKCRVKKDHDSLFNSQNFKTIVKRKKKTQTQAIEQVPIQKSKLTFKVTVPQIKSMDLNQDYFKITKAKVFSSKKGEKVKQPMIQSQKKEQCQ